MQLIGTEGRTRTGWRERSERGSRDPTRQNGSRFCAGLISDMHAWLPGMTRVTPRPVSGLGRAQTSYLAAQPASSRRRDYVPAARQVVTTLRDSCITLCVQDITGERPGAASHLHTETESVVLKGRIVFGGLASATILAASMTAAGPAFAAVSNTSAGTAGASVSTTATDPVSG